MVHTAPFKLSLYQRNTKEKAQVARGQLPATQHHHVHKTCRFQSSLPDWHNCDESLEENDDSANGKHYCECWARDDVFIKPSVVTVGDFPQGRLWVRWDVTPKGGHPPAPDPNSSTSYPSLCMPMALLPDPISILFTFSLPLSFECCALYLLEIQGKQKTTLLLVILSAFLGYLSALLLLILEGSTQMLPSWTQAQRF